MVRWAVADTLAGLVPVALVVTADLGPPSRPWWWRWAAGVITTAENQRGKRIGRLVCSKICQ